MKFKMIHENYNVYDLDKSMAFYEKALGLTERRRKEAADGSFIIVYVGNVEADYETEIRKPKANHTITYRTAKDATCTEAGYNAHYYCTVCNGAFTDEDVTNVYTDYTQATGHNNDSGIYLVDLDSNYYYYDSDFYKYCDRCGSAYMSI